MNRTKLTTRRNLKDLYQLVKAIKQNGLQIRNEEGRIITIITPGSAIAWAAKRLCDKWSKIIASIEENLEDIRAKHFMTDERGKFSMVLMGNTDIQKAGKAACEKEANAYLDVEIEVETYICPPNKLPEEVPFQLEPLNGFLLIHEFWDEFEEQAAPEN